MPMPDARQRTLCLDSPPARDEIAGRAPASERTATAQPSPRRAARRRGLRLPFRALAAALLSALLSAGLPAPSPAAAAEMPVASFTASATTGQAPLTVQFTDASTGDPYNWSWQIPGIDGDPDLLATQSPLVVFDFPGEYRVDLCIDAVGGYDCTDAPLSITVTAAPVGFAWLPARPVLGQEVVFTDTSAAPAANYDWDFGDGEASTAWLARHTYAAPGTYTVTLAVSGAGGASPVTVSRDITVRPPAPVAAFTADAYTVSPGVPVSFTDTSTGTTISRYWDFGDGAASADQDPHPSHAYDAPGVYTVTLFVFGADYLESTATADITIVSSSPPAAGFTASATSGTAGATLFSFTDTSTGFPTSWSWDFGDGSASALQDPGHTYAAPGTYTVSLTAANAGGSDTMTRADYITVVSPSSPAASFSASPASGTAPLLVAFTDASTGSPASWSWDFGDGGTSTLRNPSHTYAAAGDYTVSLTASSAGGTSTRTMPGLITVQAARPTVLATAVSGYRSVVLDWDLGSVPGGMAGLEGAAVFTDDGTGLRQAWSCSIPLYGGTGCPSSGRFTVAVAGDGARASLMIGTQYSHTAGWSDYGAGFAEGRSLPAPSTTASGAVRAVSAVSSAPAAYDGQAAAAYAFGVSSDNGLTWSTYSGAAASRSFPVAADGAAYLVRSRAQYTRGAWSSWSAPASATTAVLAAPGLAATAAVRAVTGNLTERSTDPLVPAPAKWSVEASVDGGLTWTANTGTSNPRTVTGLGDNKFIQVRGRFAYGSVWGPYSAVATVKTPLLLAPSVTLSTGLRTASASWTMSPPDGSAIPTAYRVEWTTDSGATWTAVSTISSVTAWTSPALPDDTGITVRVAAVYGSVVGPFTAKSGRTQSLVAPAVSAFGGTRSAAVTWTMAAPAGAAAPTGYLVSWSADGGATWTNASQAADLLSRNVAGLPDDTVMTIRVAAIYGGVTGPAGFATAATANPDPTVPALSASAGAGAVNVKWRAPLAGGTPTGYLLEATRDGGANWTTYRFTAATLAYAVKADGSMAAVGLRLRALYGAAQGTAATATAVTLPVPTAAAVPSSGGAVISVSAPVLLGVSPSGWSYSWSADGGATWTSATAAGPSRAVTGVTAGTPLLVRARVAYAGVWTLWSPSAAVTAG